MIITVLVSVAAHTVIAGIYSYFLLLPILYSFCLQQAPQLIMILSLAHGQSLNLYYGPVASQELCLKRRVVI